MCYSIPGKVEIIKDSIATISYFGEERKAHVEIDSLKEGDYVYAQGGYVISVLSADEAHSILSVWKETFFELQEHDLNLSMNRFEGEGVERSYLRIIDKALEARPLKRHELLRLLQTDDDRECELLFKTANFLRHKYLGNSCCVHGIVEFSNFCSQHCHYCGISAYNNSLTRYRLSEDELIRACSRAIVKHNFKALVLQSGEDCGWSAERLAAVIRRIKNEHDVLIFISTGTIGRDALQVLYDAGARGLLMRFESSNPDLYAAFHPDTRLDDRLKDLRDASDIGYLIITGAIIGLPGQSDEDLLNDIYLTKSLGAEMYSFGPFIPHSRTPLAGIKSISAKLVMKALALMRILDYDNAKILITTAFETLDKSARQSGLMAGANSVMLNVTPKKYTDYYSIYPDRAYSGENLGAQIKDTVGLLRSLGRAPSDLGI